MSTTITPSIAPEVFYKRMRERWVSELGNVYTPELGMQWAELCAAFNAHIRAHDNPEARERYTVVNAALGAGKTQGTILYAAMLAETYAEEQQPGVLIVTRRIQDAEEIAATINQLAGRERFAVAYHSEISARALKLSALAEYPAVVVTHRGYQIALDQMARDGANASRWPDFTRYREGQRKLNVIDEAIDLVEHDNLTVEALKRVMFMLIPDSTWAEHREEWQLLNETLDHLRSPEAFKLPDGRRAMLYTALKRGDVPDLSALHAKVRCTSFRALRWGRRVVLSGEEARDAALEVLRAVERVYRQWAYVAKLPTGEQMLHTARLLLPRNTKGGVILDATAKANVLYRLFGERVEIHSLPFPTRNYRNVRFLVSKGHKTGKGYIVEGAEEAAAEIIGNLSRHFAPTRKVLLVTHKDAEASFAQYSTPFESFTAHWGAIDGSNEWRDCDSVCVVSLPRRPDTWADSSYMAITGDVRDAILGEEGDQMRQEVRVGQVVSDVAQAIGRTRCRKVTNAEGDCGPVDVVLFVPDSPEGEAIVSGLLEHFSGAQLQAFEYSGAVTRVRPKASKIEEAFLLCLKGLPHGRTTAKELREVSFRACSRNSWTRLTEALKDPASELHKAMVALGIVFHPGSKGRGAGAAFVRA